MQDRRRAENRLRGREQKDAREECVTPLPLFSPNCRLALPAHQLHACLSKLQTIVPCPHQSAHANGLQLERGLASLYTPTETCIRASINGNGRSILDQATQEPKIATKSRTGGRSFKSATCELSFQPKCVSIEKLHPRGCCTRMGAASASELRLRTITFQDTPTSPGERGCRALKVAEILDVF